MTGYELLHFNVICDVIEIWPFCEKEKSLLIGMLVSMYRNRLADGNKCPSVLKSEKNPLLD